MAEWSRGGRLVIRAAQMAALAGPDADAAGMRHLAQAFPEPCRQLGPTALRDLVRVATARARRYGLVAEVHRLQYLNLALCFGAELDTDPTAPWAARILADPDLYPDEKLDRLYAAARRALDDGADPGGGAPEPAGRPNDGGT